MTNSYIDDNNDNNGHHNHKADVDNGDKLLMITTIMITITKIMMLMIIMMITRILRNIVRISKDIIKVIILCCLIYIMIYIYTYISFIINVIKTWWPVSQSILRTISLTLFRSQFKCDGNSVWLELCPWSMNHYKIWHCVLGCAKYGSDTVNKG